MTTQPRCHFCGNQIDPRYDYERIRGWVKPRSAGGANAIALRETHPQGMWACTGCIEKRKRGITEHQATMDVGP